MTASPVPGLPAAAATLPALLALLPNGIVYYVPVRDAADAVVDFRFAYLNPAAQRMLDLPAQPAASYLEQWPGSVASGGFAFHRDTYLAGTPGQLDQFYQADGYDMAVRAHAVRLEDGLLVSFTDGNDQSRTAAEEALRESQARERAARAEAEAQQATLRYTFEQAPMAIAILDGPAHRISFANAEMALLWGRPLAQVAARDHFEALPDLAGQGFEDIFADVYRTGQPCYLREQLVQIDRIGTGEQVPGYFNIVYQPRREAQGRITGIIASATEVTTQVVARQQLQQLNDELELRVTARSAEVRAALHDAEQQREELRTQQALLGQILGQVPAVIATFRGPEHRLSFFNAAYQQITGGRVALGKSVAEALPETVEQGFVALLDQVYASGQPYHGTEIAIMLTQPTGSATQHYFDFTYQPLNDAHGQRQGLLAFAVDVTEQVRVRKQADTLQAGMLAATQRQAQHRQDLYQIFEQTPAAIVLLRAPDHRIDYFNPAFEAMFPPEEWTGPLHGHQLAEVYPRLKVAGLVGLLDRVYATGEPQVVIEMPLAELQPGSPRYVTFAYQAYREEGCIAGVAAFVYEVTDQVLARQQVQGLNEELAAINEEMRATNAELADTNHRLTRTNADLDTFVYTASHDLKAPISNIEGLLLALRQQLPPAALQADLVPRLLDMMQGSVARFQQTIGHLTDISQLQRAEAPATVDLAALVSGVHLDLAPLLEATPVTLTVAVEGCHAVRVPPKTLRSVVYNLLSNAVKYRAPDRPAQVALRAYYTSGRLVLAVQDNGLGLSAAQQGELFGMFRRLHAHVEGSGVGLFMVKRLVENAGGSITVDSQPGIGSTFTVTLPA